MLPLKRASFCIWIYVLTSFHLCKKVNTSPTGVNATTSPVTTTPHPTYPPSCTKRKFNVCWKSYPPYIFKEKNATTGILKESLEKALKACGCPGNELIFRTQVGDQKGIENCTLSDDISFIIPFLPYPQGAAREQRFLWFVESPGMVLVLNQKKLTEEAMSKALNEVTQVWTVAVLIFLLAAIFGILVWFLDMHSNPEEFPKTFFPGVLEGLWWSFVTLTTVGYGDKAPKYPLARFFSVIWMFVGMVMVSLLTATMITALTSGRSDNYDNLVDKKIGVLNESPALDEANKKGAKCKKYSSLINLYRALENQDLDGILVDSLIASFVPNNYDVGNTLFKAYSYGFSYKHGMIIGNAELGNTDFVRELKGVVEQMQPTLHVTIDKYVQGQSNLNEKKEINKRYQLHFNIFAKDTNAFQVGLKILGAILAFLVLCGIMWEIVSVRRRKSRNISKKGKDILSMDTHTRLSPVEVKQMLERLEDLEKTFAKLSEFSHMYRRLKVDIQSYTVSEAANGNAHHGIKNSAYDIA